MGKIVLDTLRLWQLEAYPLTIGVDDDPASIDLQLHGSLLNVSTFAYRLSLLPNVAYRFAAGGIADGFEEAAVLVDLNSGELRWGNPTALTALGVAPSLIPQGSESAVLSAYPRDTLLLVTDVPSLQSLAGLPAGGSASAGSDTDSRLFDITVRADTVSVADDPVYRFVKPATGMYFYTASQAEAQTIRSTLPEFRYEGPVFVGDAQPRADWVPVYRYANLQSGGYFYTANPDEIESIALTQPNLRPEGIAFWSPPGGDASTTPVFRLVNLDTGGYLFTANRVEKVFALLQGGWRDEGVAFQAVAEPSTSKADALGELAAQPSDPGVSLVGVADQPLDLF